MQDAHRRILLMNAPAAALNRPFYYANADTDPSNADRVFLGAEGFYGSEDGGRTFRTLRSELNTTRYELRAALVG